MDFQSAEKVPDSSGPQFLERHQKVEEVIEQHWRQVEKTPIREERRVPLPSTGLARETVELEHTLDNYKQGVRLLLILGYLFSIGVTMGVHIFLLLPKHDPLL